MDIFHSIIEELPEKETGKEKIKLPENIREFAKKVGELAEKLGIKAYIVGGVVRDILLQKPVWDLDIVVEGEENVDAIQLAKKVAEEYGVKVHIFEEFRTAHLKLGNLKVEFATACREKYEGAGAYPKVERASLKAFSSAILNGFCSIKLRSTSGKNSPPIKREKPKISRENFSCKIFRLQFMEGK